MDENAVNKLQWVYAVIDDFKILVCEAIADQIAVRRVRLQYLAFVDRADGVRCHSF